VPDLPAPHPTNTRDGAALLTERFAIRKARQDDAAVGGTPIAGTSVAAQLIATWFAPVRPVDDDG
jgi:hypothetical protein